MIADTNPWLGGAFWRDRDSRFAYFAAERASKKAKPAEAATAWLWPGAGKGVRGPMPDETPLSQSEVDCLA